MQEFEDEDMPGENSTNTALDGEDQLEDGVDNEDTTKNYQNKLKVARNKLKIDLMMF